jgi:hypothetical protein
VLHRIAFPVVSEWYQFKRVEVGEQSFERDELIPQLAEE